MVKWLPVDLQRRLGPLSAFVIKPTQDRHQHAMLPQVHDSHAIRIHRQSYNFVSCSSDSVDAINAY